MKKIKGKNPTPEGAKKASGQAKRVATIHINLDKFYDWSITRERNLRSGQYGDNVKWFASWFFPELRTIISQSVVPAPK